MYLDALGLVSDAQAFTGAATPSTHTIDLGATTPAEIGTGEEIGFGISVDVAAGAGSTAKIDVIQSASADLSSPTVIATISIAAALLVAGKALFLPIIPGFPTQRYLGIQETSTGGTTTITLTAWFTARSLFSILAKPYAKNYVV